MLWVYARAADRSGWWWMNAMRRSKAIHGDDQCFPGGVALRRDREFKYGPTERGPQTFMSPTFQVIRTAIFTTRRESRGYADLGLSVFETHPQIAVQSFKNIESKISPDQIAGANGAIRAPRLRLRGRPFRRRRI